MLVHRHTASWGLEAYSSTNEGVRNWRKCLWHGPKQCTYVRASSLPWLAGSRLRLRLSVGYAASLHIPQSLRYRMDFQLYHTKCSLSSLNNISLLFDKWEFKCLRSRGCCQPEIKRLARATTTKPDGPSKKLGQGRHLLHHRASTPLHASRLSGSPLNCRISLGATDMCATYCGMISWGLVGGEACFELPLPFSCLHTTATDTS
jgi:hypothetical protein